MVSTIKTGRYSPRKVAKQATTASFTQVSKDATITWLEKGGQSGGATTKELIEDALDEYSRLFKAGIASNAEKLTLARAFPDAPAYVAAAADIPESSVMVVGGPASVEMIDREGHLIKADALDRAFKKYMENFRTRNAMVLHSDVQVGWALPAYITKGGQIYKSGVNNKELFFICELRGDTKIAERVAKQIEDGKLRSYSIAGSATKVQNMQKGVMPYMQVEDMELAEVTVCEKGVNQGAAFQILKDQCGYRPATDVEIENGIMCGTCKFFNKEDKTCDTVDGVFEDTDYCKIFDAEEAQPEMEEGPKVKVKLILSDDNNIEFNKTLQELVQNPEWSTTDGGLQTQRDWWDWDLPLEKQIELGKQANTDRARVHPEGDIHNIKPPLHRSTAKRIDEDIKRRIARSPETLRESATSIEIQRDREKDIKSYADKAKEAADGKRVTPTLPVVSEVREEMEGLPETISRSNKGVNKMEKSLTGRLIDLYKAAGDIGFTNPSKGTTPSKGRGNAGMGGGSVTPAMGNPELQLAEFGDKGHPPTEKVLANLKAQSRFSGVPESVLRTLIAQNPRASEKMGTPPLSPEESAKLIESDPTLRGIKERSDARNPAYLGDKVIPSKETLRANTAEVLSRHRGVGDGKKRPSMAEKFDVQNVNWNAPGASNEMTRRVNEEMEGRKMGPPSDPSGREDRGIFAMEKGIKDVVNKLRGRGESSNYRGKELAEKRAAYHGGDVEDWMQNRNPESAIKVKRHPNHQALLDLEQRAKEAGTVLHPRANRQLQDYNEREEWDGRYFTSPPPDMTQNKDHPAVRFATDPKYRESDLGQPRSNPSLTAYPVPGTENQLSSQYTKPGTEGDNMKPVTKSLTERLLKLYKANDDPMTTKESFTTLNNYEGRKKEHDQLLREYGFPSEVDPEANRYIPVIETETDDDGVPINVKGPWVVNEAGNDVGELLDEDAPSFSASEKAHNREGKKTASVSKSYLEKPPVTPFLSKRSL